MKIIIIGAGELGCLLAERLSASANDITIIDFSREGFTRLRDKLDVMTLAGDATNIEIMKKAGIEHADLLLAVSGDQAANILACQIAGHFGVKKSICRLYSFEVFSEKDGLTPEFFGIGRAFSSPAECARKVLDVLHRRIVLERVIFSNPDATMVTTVISPNSPLKGLRIKDLPGVEILNNIRFAALVRGHQLMFPHGETVLFPNDKIYVAGRRDYVEDFLNSASEETDLKKQLVIIAGATRLCEIIAHDVLKTGMAVRVIESSAEAAEQFLTRMPPGVMVVQGSATDKEVLNEAGIDCCDTFVSTADDDENSILCCIIAKRLGARKVIAVTHKPEYISIVPVMDVIDCGFNSTLVSVNTVFRLMEEGTIRIDSRLQAFQAYLTEFTVKPNAQLDGKLLKDCRLPTALVLAMIFRGNEVITPAGSTMLQAGDVVVTIVTPASEQQIKPFFE
ncbi:MAG: Trk system potassium transporter TrkA [Oligosphaeraceae bacterium]|nr:Trk system potassium transporter TrkA [Oligosphaeraceae bacterium]